MSFLDKFFNRTKGIVTSSDDLIMPSKEFTDIGMSGYINRADYEHELTMVHADMDDFMDSIDLPDHPYDHTTNKNIAKADRAGLAEPVAQDAERPPEYTPTLGDILSKSLEADVFVQPIIKHTLENGYGADFYHTIANRIVDLHNNMSKDTELVLAIKMKRK